VLWELRVSTPVEVDVAEVRFQINTETWSAVLKHFHHGFDRRLRQRSKLRLLGYRERCPLPCSA